MAAGASPATRMLSASVGVEGPWGADRARRAQRSARSARTASGARASGDRRGPALPAGPPRADGAGRGGPSAGRAPRWRARAWAGRCATRGWARGCPGGGCRCPARAWLRPRTATVSPPRCRSPRWAADASSGLWAPPRRPGRRPVPPPRAGAHAPHPRRRPGLGSGGGLPEGWDSPTHRRRTRWPGARRGNGLGHALTPLPPPRAALPSPLRQAWHAHCHPLRHRARQRKGGRVLARGQRLRPVADRGTAPAGTANGERGRRGCQATQAGGEAVREAPQRPATSTLVAPAHHALERTGGARPGVPQPGGRQQAWRTGLVPLYTLGPSQRRAQHAGPGGVEVEGGNVPTQEWFLNRQRRTSGGLR